jgi:hypothetical protein
LRLDIHTRIVLVRWAHDVVDIAPANREPTEPNFLVTANAVTCR